MLNVAAFTGGLNVPSARFRVRQYIPVLESYGLCVREMISRATAYPPTRGVMRRVAWGVRNVLEHVVSVPRSWTADVTLLQREFVSGIYTVEWLARRPMVLDVDDAIWLHGGLSCARRLAKSASSVICGNDFLANWFARYNRRITIVP